MNKAFALISLAAVLAPPPGGALSQTKGIWSSPNELRRKPTEGPAWKAVWKAANNDTHKPTLAENMDRTNVRVLAAAIVYARTGDERFKDKVVAAIQKLVEQGKPGGSTLAWARQLGAYPMAADLVEYRRKDFDVWLRQMAEVYEGEDGRTLRVMFERRANNWGSHAFGSLCAIYSYLDDREALADVRDYWVRGVRGPNPGYRYGDDLSWHLDQNDLRLINPKGAMKDGVNIDGFYPDDMRRGGSFQRRPVFTNYAWEVQQGNVMAARVLERAGMPIWDVGDRALGRAAYALQVRLGGEWRAQGDDLWMLAFYDQAYGTNWSAGQDEEVWEHGKNAGWAYVLLPDEQ